LGPVLSLWWSLLWRITLAILAISFPVGQLVASFAGSDPAWIQLKPTVAWLLVAAIFWAIATVAAGFFSAVLSGNKLGLPEQAWQRLARLIAGFFAGLAVLNWLVASSVPEEAWIRFTLYAPYPLLMVLLLVLASRMRMSGDLK
jgi:intracellular septation protein A